jgi:hypothetical protein
LLRTRISLWPYAIATVHLAYCYFMDAVFAVISPISC